MKPIKSHLCQNDIFCNDPAEKDKYGNYKTYCSRGCMLIGRQFKYINTYSNKSIDSITEKRRKTNLDRYGVDNVSKTEQVRKKLQITTSATADIRLTKTKLTNLANYGVESTNSLPSVKDKKKNTLIEKYGVDHQLKIPEIAASVSQKNSENAEERLAKAKITNLEKYGCENPSSNPDVQAKRTETMIERFGVENASQNAGIHAKKMKSQYRNKEFVFPSGKVVRLQGYECKAIKELLKTYTEYEIITETELIPVIPYTDTDGKTHVYFPDIYIPKDNLLIEVKSQYTYNGFIGWYETNMQKHNASILAGYNHKFMIMGRK